MLEELRSPHPPKSGDECVAIDRGLDIRDS